MRQADTNVAPEGNVLSERDIERLTGEISVPSAFIDVGRAAAVTVGLRLGDQAIVLEIADGGVSVRNGEFDDAEVDFTLTGPSHAWRIWRDREPRVGYTTLYGLLTSGAMSGGTLPAPLRVTGDLRKYAAYLALLTMVLEPVRVPR